MTIRPLDLIEPFLADVRPANPDMCREVLQVALARRFPTDPRQGIEYWSFFTEACCEVYVNVYAAGSGTGHTFKLLERWFRWMGRKGHFGNEDVALWLFELERARRQHVGMKARYMKLPDGKQITGKEVAAALSILRESRTIELFLKDVDESDHRVATLAVKNLVVWLAENRGAPVIFADFDPSEYLSSLLDARGRPSQVDAQLMHYAANYLEPRVSEELVTRTRNLALSLALAA